jgi:hypothetical protein
MTSLVSVEAALARAEQCFKALSLALVSGEPEALALSGVNLHGAALVLSTLLKQASPNDLQTLEYKKRLAELVAALGSRRESLIRRTVLVDRALNALVPSTMKSTYGKSPKAYSSVGPQTGAFKYLSA